MALASAPGGPTYDGGTRARWIVTAYTQNGAELDLTPAVVSVTWAKSLESPSGQWSVTLKRAAEPTVWDEALEDDDWIALECEVAERGRPPARHLVTVGLVDSVRETRRSAGGAEVVQWTVTGRDFGKIFEETEVYFQAAAAEAARDAAAAKSAEFSGNFAGAIFFKPGAFSPAGTPSEMVQGIVSAFLGKDGLLGGQWLVPEAVADHTPHPPRPSAPALRRLAQSGYETFGSYLDAESLVSDMGGQTVDLGLMNLTGSSGKLHSLLYQYTEPTVHELFYDVRPVTYPERDRAGNEARRSSLTRSIMTLVFRPRPFPLVLSGDNPIDAAYADGMRAPWSALPTHDVPGTHVLDANLGRGGQERYNFFLVYPAADLVQAGDPIFGAVGVRSISMDTASIRVHGLRKFEHATRYARHPGPMPAGKAADKDLAYAKAIHDRLKLWYALNPHFYNGSITLKRLRPDIRVGDRARLTWRDGREIVFYVEGVQHSWRYPQHGQTTLTVTRGVRADDARIGRIAGGGRT